MTGRLQESDGYFHMIINYKDETGKYKKKWDSTHLPIKGNKRRAEQMLSEKLREYTENPCLLFGRVPVALPEEIKMPELISEWLRVKKSKYESIHTQHTVIRLKSM